MEMRPKKKIASFKLRGWPRTMGSVTLRAPNHTAIVMQVRNQISLTGHLLVLPVTLGQPHLQVGAEVPDEFGYQDTMAETLVFPAAQIHLITLLQAVQPLLDFSPVVLEVLPIAGGELLLADLAVLESLDVLPGWHQTLYLSHHPSHVAGIGVGNGVDRSDALLLDGQAEKRTYLDHCEPPLVKVVVEDDCMSRAAEDRSYRFAGSRDLDVS
jgi:hypothetical protein